MSIDSLLDSLDRKAGVRLRRRLLSLVMGIITFSAAALIDFQFFRLPVKNPPQERAARLTEALADSLQLIEEIKKEVESGTALAAKLQADIKTYDEVAKLKQSEVESVAQLFRGELQKDATRSFWEDVGINAVFFILGLFTPQFARIFSRGG